MTVRKNIAVPSCLGARCSRNGSGHDSLSTRLTPRHGVAFSTIIRTAADCTGKLLDASPPSAKSVKFRRDGGLVSDSNVSTHVQDFGRRRCGCTIFQLSLCMRESNRQSQKMSSQIQRTPRVAAELHGGAVQRSTEIRVFARECLKTKELQVALTVA